MSKNKSERYDEFDDKYDYRQNKMKDKQRSERRNRAETLELSLGGTESLYKTLDNPPKANKKLLDAARRYKDHVKR